MITVVVLFCILLVLSFIAAVMTGLIAISPILLVIFALPVIDYFVFKLIFGRRKKK